MKRLLTPLLPLLAVIAAGCGVGPHVDDYNEALVAARLAACNCNGWVLLLQGSEAECRAEYPPDASEQACVESLFKNIDGDYEPFLDCESGAYNRAASCANGKTCTDLARGDCLTQLNDELEDCPKLPAEVQQDLNECLN